MIENISNNNFPSLARTSVMKIKEPNDLKTENVEIKTKESEDKSQIEKVIKGLNDFLTPTHTSLKFELHDKLNEYYVTLVDDKTEEVIREIPSKKLLDFYAAMTEFIGIMVDKKI